MNVGLKSLVIVVSDSISQGRSEDRSGALLVELLSAGGLICGPAKVLPDEIDPIRAAVQSAEEDLIVLTGGTGVSPRDVTPEAVLPLLEKRLEGVEQAILSRGLVETPFAMLSRIVVGTRGKQLILCLPGSPSAVRDAIGAVFPTVLHAFEVFQGKKH